MKKKEIKKTFESWFKKYITMNKCQYVNGKAEAICINCMRVQFRLKSTTKDVTVLSEFNKKYYEIAEKRINTQIKNQ